MILLWRLFLGKAQPYPSEMDKVAQDKIKTTLDDMKTTIEDRNGIVDAEFETIRSSVESVKSALTSQIQRVNVSLVILEFDCKASFDKKNVMKCQEHISFNLRKNLMKNSPSQKMKWSQRWIKSPHLLRK